MAARHAVEAGLCGSTGGNEIGLRDGHCAGRPTNAAVVDRPMVRHCTAELGAALYHQVAAGRSGRLAPAIAIDPYTSSIYVTSSRTSSYVTARIFRCSALTF